MVPEIVLEWEAAEIEIAPEFQRVCNKNILFRMAGPSDIECSIHLNPLS